MTQRASRRQFLKSTATAAGAFATVPYIYTASRAQVQSANDKLTVGSIGTSIYTNRYTGTGEKDGRGAVVGHQAGAVGNMVAVADANLRHARFFSKKYDGKCQEYQDYRKLLDRKDIDAVTIGTPDHWHSKIAIDAMRAGKHVYCEKPMSLTIHEGRQILKVAEETNKVFQVGTQQRTEFDLVFLKAVAIARSGRLGDKLTAYASVEKGVAGGPFPTGTAPEECDWDMWLGQTPQVPYCKNRHDYDFRWWLEYSGGQVTDWGVHHGDIALWALGKENTGPRWIEGKGNYPKVENGYNVAVDFDCMLTFDDGQSVQLISKSNELIIGGDRGKIRVNRGGLTGKPVEELTEKDNNGWLLESMTKLAKGKMPDGKVGAHMKNFFDCIKDGSKTISDPWTHHRSVSMCHLANIAMRLDRKLEWDPIKQSFVGDAEANAMTKRVQREKYAIDVVV